jgi:hypothetical protein
MALRINPEHALNQINIYLGHIDELLELNYKEGESKKSELNSEIRGFLESAFENGDKKGYSSSPLLFMASGLERSGSGKQSHYISGLNIMRGHLIRFRSENKTIINTDIIQDKNIFDTLELIFSNFHKVVRQLRQRYNNRETISVNEEYDVQDLLHSILKIFFSDIRPEEYTPSYAGSHRRMDFLLKTEKTVIEVKMTRTSLKNKQASEQLNDDIITYKSHNDCSTLVCFIYDPDGWISNPIGFETDLSNQSSDDLKVKAYIFPKN